MLLFNSVCPALLFAAVALVLLPRPAGAQQAIEAWVQRYDGPADASAQAYAMGMAVDGAGNAYVTGYFNPQGWATIKYSSAGEPLWTNLYNGMQAYALAVDSSGNVYVTGSNDGVTGQYCTTIKYSSSGVPLWTKLYAASGSYAHTLAVDAGGNVVVVGALSGNYLTLKYSSAGALLWARQYNGPGSGNDLAWAVALDASGNVYVTGWSEVSDSGPDYTTVAYSSAGVLLWAQRYSGPVNGQDQAWAVAVDRETNVIVTGKSQGIGGYDDAD